MAAASEALPTTLITGFLGSGKTTLLNGLLAHPGMADTAVIINEFGEIGLDHLLIESAFEDAVLLKSGCICCTVRGDLVDTMGGLIERRDRGEIPHFSRVAIETTGLADPAPILHTIMGDPKLQSLYRVDRVVTTVDAANALSQLDTHYEAAKQAALADRLVLTKTDLVSHEERERVLARLVALNPLAPVIVVVQGKVSPETLFALDPPSLALRQDRLAAAEALGDDHDHGHDHGDDHEDAAEHLARHHGISTVSLVREEPVEWPRLRSWLTALASLKGPDLLRVKGIINVAGRPGPVVIHGVQHVFHPPVELKAWPDADRRSRLVFITRNIKAEALARSFTAAMTEGARVSFP
ncbi:MAG TPA: GTP-binding protein [Stellaceae bacterium]|nr:GTP-binding protein [Stellaceae bacterium]